jgi:small subunit ribosomal protein S15
LPLAKEYKSDIIEKYALHDSDRGSTQVQIAVLTERIKHLTEHFKQHKHDHHGRRGLLKLVGRRRRLLRYLQGRNPAEYRQLIDRLGIRK